MKKPLISIALCTYNGVKYLEEQLDSLLTQSYENFEICIRDDCSEDGTWELLEKYRQLFPELIKINRNPRRLGLASNFQRVFEDTMGELIAPCDQDDIWKSHKLELLEQHIGENVLIYHDSSLMDEKGRSMSFKISQKFRFIKGNNCSPFLLFNCVSGHSMLFRKRLLDVSLPLPEIGFYDHWLVFNACLIGRIDFIPKTLVYYRQHTGNQTDLLGNKTKIKGFANSQRRIQRENAWLETCIQRLRDTKQEKWMLDFYNLAKLREKDFFIPNLGFLIWKKRNLLLPILPKNSLQSLAFSFRYSWGLKSKRLFYFS